MFIEKTFQYTHILPIITHSCITLPIGCQVNYPPSLFFTTELAAIFIFNYANIRHLYF